MNPKGHVKLELYNESGEVFFTKEKHNLVVLDANKIVANMMAQPSRKTRIASSVTSDTEFNDDGKSVVIMKQHREVEKTVSYNAGTSGVDKVELENAPYITTILSATINEVPAVVGKDIFIKDGPKGVIGFKEKAKNAIVIKYRYITNDMIDIVRGSEKVSISSTPWAKDVTPSDSALTYAVNYATGEIIFENPKSNVKVDYEYEMQYSLGFMGLGGLPAGHPDSQPVSFSKNDKYRTKLDNEFTSARQPINFPLTIEEGKPEIDVLLAKDISTVNRTQKQVAVVDDGGSGLTLDYLLDVSTVDGNRPLYQITRAEVITGTLTGRNLLTASEVTIKDATTGKVTLAGTLQAAGLAASDRIEFDYKLKSGTDHLIYELNYSPVVELKAVRFENNLGTVTDIPVDAATKGMEYGVAGKVRVLNANAGTIEFTKDFEKHLEKNPGKITVEYFVNSGTVVKFITDFPKGVPGPMALKGVEFTPDTASGVTEYTAPNVLTKINFVNINGSPTSQYSVNGQKITINDPSFNANDVLAVNYDTEITTHTIYTVAMFDSLNELSSKMFNISGIGPVTKDKNTGMRITWSVTF